MSMLDPLCDHLQAAGLNHLGLLPIADWDALAPPARKAQTLLPEAQSVLVIGNGGGALWEAFCADLRAEPRHLTEEAHPLNAYVRRVAAGAAPLLGDAPHRWFFVDDEPPIDLRALARAAGLGAPSRLGLLIHPTHGLWMGLRAVLLTPLAPPPRPAPAPDLCGPCPAPCAAACVGGAFPAGTFEIMRCIDFHVTDTACAASCAARSACPVGVPYPPLAQAYHNARETGRRALADQLGIVGDRHSGVGPQWARWSRVGR